ncbi:Uncharacterised protein [Mycobacteroides abscessus subsp. abscessus]|nr:Uncharacterised protein [Mycobacteroides abscessus subsp. abscessus]
MAVDRGARLPKHQVHDADRAVVAANRLGLGLGDVVVSEVV